MASPNMTARLDLAGDEPAAAKTRIRELLKADPGATRKVYAALAHKVWSLLIERRLDAEVRDWHGLLQDVRAAVRAKDGAAAERIVALSDLLGESISLAETSPANELAQRPHAKRILIELSATRDFVPRRHLLELLKLKTTHLSNVLSQLVAHNLIERRDTGRETAFRLTARGRDVLKLEPVFPLDELVLHMRDYALLVPPPSSRIAAAQPVTLGLQAARLGQWYVNKMEAGTYAPALVAGGHMLGGDGRATLDYAHHPSRLREDAW